MHRPVDTNPSFPALEEDVLEWWTTNDIQKRALGLREGAPELVFYEGPPFANAPPGVHSVLPRVIKDVYTRFQTMKGRYVTRQAGWDCHGLPAEVEVEKRLGFTSKRQILDYGVEKFNHLCRTSVSEYITNYVHFSDRIAFWLDYENAYQTMSNEYIESVWWSLAELHRKGLLFEAHRVAPYCPRCETPLSDHELGQDGVYQEVTDPGVTLAFPLDGAPTVTDVPLEDAALCVWTTTPWTLIANLACAVHPDLEYVLVEHGGRRLILAVALVETALGLEEPLARIATFAGRDLVGLKYRPPFDYARRSLERVEGAVGRAWRVLGADFVNVAEGTGVVHLAGAFGADDLDAVRKAEIPVYNPVDASGNFDATVPELSGSFVKAADAQIVEMLGASGLLVRSEPYVHSYPHCWRCKSALLYYALISWYIRTTEFRDRMIEVNSGVNWVPEHIRDGRYGKWLENNVDWSLSRFRFWGTPLPLWRCPDAHDVAVESVAQLSELAGRDLTGLDLHRPHVDEITFACGECAKQMRRIPDVIDVWYDSGAMPFAQHGYPHREGSTEAFRRRFPADFIAEGLDQIRGWFYSLMAESVALFDQNSYNTVICHGLVLEDTGKKMSKTQTVSDPWAVLSRFGSDALRFYYLSAGDPSENRRLSEQALEQVIRGPFLTLWNVYKLYVMYANIDGFDPNTWEPIAPHFRPALDRWILSELHQVTFEVDDALSTYDSLRASRRIVEFIDDLSNWYVRRSRRRFWRSAADEEERADKSAAYWTLWTCLVDLSALLAPFAPFLSDQLYRNLVCEVNPSAPASVHLSDFPEGDPNVVDPRLAAGMAAARELASLGHSARSDARMKVRQPLGAAVLLVPEDLRDAVEEVGDLLADELNVVELSFAEEVGDLVRITLRPNYRTAGPELGSSVRPLAQALAALEPQAAEDLAAAVEEGLDVEVETEAGPVRVNIELIDIRREPASGTAFAYEAPFGVSLDLHVTPELRREGIAREFVHQVQSVRRDLGLDVTDRIAIVVQAPDEVIASLHDHTDYVTEELLATGIDHDGSATEPTHTIAIEGTEVRVAVRKA
ncbi:MAG: isoleucine--tRNA ligase [Actinomycetota bacterium]